MLAGGESQPGAAASRTFLEALADLPWSTTTATRAAAAAAATASTAAGGSSGSGGAQGAGAGGGSGGGGAPELSSMAPSPFLNSAALAAKQGGSWLARVMAYTIHYGSHGGDEVHRLLMELLRVPLLDVVDAHMCCLTLCPAAGFEFSVQCF